MENRSLRILEYGYRARAAIENMAPRDIGLSEEEKNRAPKSRDVHPNTAMI